jgi:iron complex transport system substrate-binding protein
LSDTGRIGTTRRQFLLGAGALVAGSQRVRAQARRTVVDDAGRKADLSVSVSRVYAAGPPASILVFALAPDKLVGWTSAFRPEERPFVPAKYADLPTLGRLTGRGNTANIEVVLAANPDLIVDYGSVLPTYASLADRVHSQTGIPYLLFDGAFDRIPQSLARLGEILGEATRGAEWERYAQGILADITARVANIPPGARPRVYYGRGPRGLDTGLAGSINMESIERVGATNVAAALGRGGLTQVSVEQVLAWNPDVIITIDRTFYANVWRDPLWQGLSAVRTKRVFLSPNVPFGWIDFPPSINRLVGLRWLARTLYPDAFPEDLRPFVRDFYSRAYHQTPTPDQLDMLVRSAEPRRG